MTFTLEVEFLISITYWWYSNSQRCTHYSLVGRDLNSLITIIHSMFGGKMAPHIFPNKHTSSKCWGCFSVDVMGIFHRPLQTNHS